MTTSLPTSEKLDGPEVFQFSVFLRNKVGALLEVVKMLQEHNIVVLALSVLDSSESAIGRMVVSDPDRVRKLFNEQGIPFSECSVLLVELEEGAADLGHVLAVLLMAEVNIHFSYPLLTRPRGRAVLAFYVDDADCARSVLLGEDFILLNQADISR